ncbi:MAG: tRNA (guanosine(37)-N1)-methyltransferase TrmD [Pirellulales bacterium]|nr:tRNA (guanosine(37)-N1)-methyltransferase TrmD [Pirellulales bacterium]
MRFDILTLFPELFSGYVGQSLLAKAIGAQRVTIQLHNIRDWARDRHRQVDDRPFGGGPGMVFKPEPVVECVEAVQKLAGSPGHLVLLSPKGRRLDQSKVEELAGYEGLVLLCGRYEGFDQRIIDILQPDEISIGDYVLNGGEVAAMVVIDSVVRLLPGVLGDEQSAWQDSFSGERRQIEYAQYTRPREYRGHVVPDVLTSGDHSAVARWREEDSRRRTEARRAQQMEIEEG